MKNKKIFFLSLFLLPLIFLPSFSKGDRYFSKISKWYSLAAANNWEQADQLEKQLDPADTLVYKSTHRPEELKKYINTLTLKSNKSVEDWLELARVQSILGKDSDAYLSLTTAKNLDPVRDDISQIYYQTRK